MSKQTVFVGMSGGVDSSLTAALLIEQGFDVVGVYMKNWTRDLPGFDCPWREDFEDAQRVAVGLDIPFEVFDFEKDYQDKVVQYMIDEYRLGRTPNPDVMCNQEVKFKLFLDLAKEKGADMIATGHYARIERGDDGQSSLIKAANAAKDQTYFLYRVSQEALQMSLMPIGDFVTKEEVRQAARDRGIETAEKKDSQGICFVGKVGIKEFLSQFVETKPGPIVDSNGVRIGEHEGAIFYTIGQRHGLNVGGGLPYYVTHKDIEANTVYVTTDLNDPALWHDKLTLRSLTWINDAPESGKTYKVQARYRGPFEDCTVTLEGDDLALATLQAPLRGIAAGQSAVIYDADRVVGGGIVSN